MTDCMLCGEPCPQDITICTRCEEEFWDDPGVVPNTFDEEAEEDDLADAH